MSSIQTNRAHANTSRWYPTQREYNGCCLLHKGTLGSTFRTLWYIKIRQFKAPDLRRILLVQNSVVYKNSTIQSSRSQKNLVGTEFYGI